MSDIHDTTVGNGPENSTGGATDKARPDEISSPEKELAPLGMEELLKLHPRFWIPVWSDPDLAAEAEALIPLYAGDDDRARVLALARDVAEAQIDERRARTVISTLEKSASGKNYVLDEPARFIDFVVAAKQQPRTIAAKVILAIYRYERRAFSRWMKAMNAFKVAVRREAPSITELLMRNSGAATRSTSHSEEAPITIAK